MSGRRSSGLHRPTAAGRPPQAIRWRFDGNDIGTQIAERLHGVRSHQEVVEAHHPHATQQTLTVAHIRPRSARARILARISPSLPASQSVRRSEKHLCINELGPIRRASSRSGLERSGRFREQSVLTGLCTRSVDRPADDAPGTRSGAMAVGLLAIRLPCKTRSAFRRRRGDTKQEAAVRHGGIGAGK